MADQVFDINSEVNDYIDDYTNTADFAAGYADDLILDDFIDSEFNSWLPSYPPALYRYLLCAGLSGYMDQVLENVAFNSAGNMPENIRMLIEGSPKRMNLYCGADRDAFGLLVPIAAALNRNCEFLISESLMDESMFSVLKTLKVHGIKHELISRNIMRIWGRLTTGTYIIPSGMDPSFLSGLLMALPLLKENSIIMVDGPFMPDLHVNLTLKSLERAGIHTEIEINDSSRENAKGSFIGASFRIRGSQQYALDMTNPAGDNWPYN